MRKYIFATLFLGSCLFCHAAEGWEDLLDQDLAKWEIFMGVPHKTVKVPNYPKTESDGKTGTPLGLGKDPLGVFTTYQEADETILRISGEIYGGLTTKQEYGNYHFKCQFRWGEKKWEPRLDKKRDSGVLYHAKGPHGVVWNAWMQSLEFQIQENQVGDFITVLGPTADIRVEKTDSEKISQYNPNSPLRKSFRGTALRGPGQENGHGEWNTVEILTYGQKSVFILNSTRCMVFQNAMYKNKAGEMLPLTNGRIQIQSEGAEIEYRNMMIKPIDCIPLF